MPLFRVHFTHPETGAEASALIDAENAKAARDEFTHRRAGQPAFIRKVKLDRSGAEAAA